MKTQSSKAVPGSPEFLTIVQKSIAYYPRLGVLRWLGNSKLAGVSEEGTERRMIVLQGRSYPPEKIAWMLEYGQWPAGEIGFKNGIEHDFLLENLFELQVSCEVVISRISDLFALNHAGEQVTVSHSLHDVMEVAKGILEGK